mmetsp:Transcript_20012/g.42754  ORF Transcript_20012/g.42754 Transcript_20012/m.42754 type:complete len:214 (+) Transcript_20012:621-1262(+)
MFKMVEVLSRPKLMSMERQMWCRPRRLVPGLRRGRRRLPLKSHPRVSSKSPLARRSKSCSTASPPERPSKASRRRLWRPFEGACSAPSAAPPLWCHSAPWCRVCTSTVLTWMFASTHQVWGKRRAVAATSTIAILGRTPTSSSRGRSGSRSQHCTALWQLWDLSSRCWRRDSFPELQSLSCCYGTRADLEKRWRSTSLQALHATASRREQLIA